MAMDDQRIKFDEIDLKILSILQKQGRITNAKLASQAGLSAPPMLERVKKLERAGIIKSYCAILDAKKLGCDFLTFVGVNVDIRELGRMDELEQAIVSRPEVLECHHIAGEIDFLLKVNVYDQEDYKHFVADHLAKVKGINRMVSWVVLHTSKDSREILLPQPQK